MPVQENGEKFLLAAAAVTETQLFDMELPQLAVRVARLDHPRADFLVLLKFDPNMLSGAFKTQKFSAVA